ncbi:MAG: iron-containing alcohol dehydrogenase [Elusimicrobia bacterium]|nr:iron-containing alcohol dehydrogenase [Elusimicrobiota bacterium]
MQNFVFHNPTKIIFGKNTAPQIGEITAPYGKKALLVYGEGSIKKTGLYNLVIKSLKDAGVAAVEHAGVKPNPVISHARIGADIAKKHGVEVIVAVGGGSVIDSAKTISAAVKYDGDPWDFFSGKASPKSALPIVTILTLSATGSEMNCGAVITNEETKDKWNFLSPAVFPKVSILDPILTMTVPKYQTLCGAVDIMAHILEVYFAFSDEHNELQDELAHGVIKNLMRNVETLLSNPKDYNARAEMMWSSTLALNGMIRAGAGPSNFINHLIEHSVSALYDVTHGGGLAVVMPAWLENFWRARRKIVRFGF